MDPELFNGASIAASSTTQVNTTVFTNSTHTVRRVYLGRLDAFMSSQGAASSEKLLVLRRVPAGYSAPTISVSLTGSVSNITDAPNVVAFGLLKDTIATAAFSNSQPVKLIKRFNSVLLYEGDSLILSSVSSVTATNATFCFICPMEIETVQN